MNLSFGLISISGGLNLTTEDANKQRAVEFFTTYGFDPEIPGIHAGDNKVLKDNVIKRFGQPTDVKIVTGPDRNNPGGTFEFVTLEYPGLSIRLMRQGDAPKGEYEISQIVLTSSQYRLKYGLGIGQPKAAFLKILGAPTEAITYPDKKESMSYMIEKDSGETYSAVFEFDSNDQAISISWYHLAE